MMDFSVHLLTYNNEKHIGETLQSILKQKVDFDYEIVVGDDCSTDKTLAIIKQYEANYPELFKIKKNESQLGILKNFKATLDRCKGNYVFPLAGDDLLKNEYALQKMYHVLSKNNSLSFIDSGFDKYYQNSGKTIKFGNKKIIESSKKVYQDTVLLGKITPVGICFNRNLLLKFVDFNTYIEMDITIDDYPILVNLIKKSNFERIHESLIIYRIHENSFSHKRTFESHYSSANQMKKLFDYFSEKYDFEDNIIESYNKAYLKQLLFFAGFFQKKTLGKEVFSKLKSKSIKDRIHYWASQNKLFRKLVSIV